jgi:hypothetical protein
MVMKSTGWTHAHPGAIAVEHIQVSLHFIDMFPKFVKIGNRPQVSKVAHGDRQIKDIGYKVRRRGFSSRSVNLHDIKGKDATIWRFVFLYPFRRFIAGRLDTGFFLNIYARRMRKILRVYPINLKIRSQAAFSSEKQ